MSVFGASVLATIIHVPADVPTIQAGIDAAIVGDTVLVSAGTYFENLDYAGKDVVLVSESGPELTIIDGSANENTVVLFINGESRTAVLEGFTIQNGRGILKYPGVSDERFAGGICIRFDSSPTLRNLIVTNNSVPINEHLNNAAGGIGVAFGSAPLLEDIVISNNQARYGGGLYTHYAAPILKNVTFSDNYAARSGGGAGFKTSTPTINNVLVYDNTAGNYGGGFFIYDTSDVVINGATFYGNGGGPGGGAIVTINRNNVSVINSVCWGNTPNQIRSFIYYGGGYNYGPGQIGIANSDIQGGESQLSLQNGELSYYENNLGQDPLFENSDLDDFHLTETSPCIDAGTSVFVWAGDTLLNIPEGAYFGMAPEMGTFEFYPPRLINVPEDFATIQAAIDTSMNGDTILVQPGTYVENINFNGKNVILGSLTLTSGDTAYISQTIIDGDSSGTVVRFENGEDSTAILNGFTITNGHNHNDHGGGGIFCANSSPTISNMNITGNSANNGGGMEIANSNPTLTSVTITDNEAFQYEAIIGPGGPMGGGIYCSYSSPTLINVTVENNTAQFGGAGIFFGNGNPILSNVTIVGNSAAVGGGIWFLGSNLRLINSIVWNNSPNQVSALVRNPPLVSSTITISFSDIEGGIDSIAISDIDTVNWAEGNIDLDPLFVDADNGDYSLQEGSPCVDAGTALYTWEGIALVDIPDSLYNGLAPDMGALESPYTTVSIEGSNLLPDEFALYQNFPNPFNPTTTISYALAELSDVTLTIYDITGRELIQIVNSNQSSGYHDIKWSGMTAAGNMVSTGVYFCQISAGSNSKTIKMLYLK